MSFYKFIVLSLFLGLISCQKAADQKSSANTKPLSPLAQKGKGVFMSNCIACHNMDPRLDGSIGPAIAGSSMELLTHRILTRDYPAGYMPKRKSEQMPDFPQLKEEIPAIHAYLNSLTP